jgi:hypothetical protein
MSCDAETKSARSSASRRAWGYFKEVFVALALVTVALSLTQSFKPSVALAYTCVYDHCYGRVDWTGAFNGETWDASIVHMSGGNSRITNETWVSDCDPYYFDNLDCTGPGRTPHWVETGYVSDSNGEYYYWADQRPVDNTYHEHDLNQAGSCDYGNYTYFDIHRYTSSSFEIDISSCSYGVQAYSTNNTMSPSAILTGQELVGTSGASAPRAYFINNTWIGTDGVYHYWGSNGGIYGANPPSAGWSTLPSNSSTGGVLWTNCC